MATKKKNKRMRQTKLYEHPLSSPGSSTRTAFTPQKSSKPPRKRLLSPSGEEDSEEDLSNIRLETKPINISDSDSDDNPSPVKRKRLVRGSKKAVVSDDEDKPIHKRRRLQRGRAVESSESEDLEEEVEKERILSSRFRARDKKTAFQKNLERLKRKKQGKPLDSPSESEGEESEANDGNAPFKGAKPTTGSDHDSLFDESDADDSDDFIVEDDNEVVPSLPMQFSMETHQDLDHQFKKIFQFFVHIAVRPGPERKEFMKEQMRDQEYFSVPLKIVRRKLSGLRDSLVASSIWKPEYRKKLETYPEFDLFRLDFSVPSCDACNLRSRISTMMGRLSGLPYDRMGFEVDERYLGGGDSDASDNDSDRFPATVELDLGKFCARRTRVYHQFSHWEWAVFKCIRDELDDLQDVAGRGKKYYKIAYPGAKKPPRDLTDADGICDWLDSRRVIDGEWEKLKAMMESARHLELAAKNADADDD